MVISSRMPRRAFTRIELIVLIGLIFFLFALLMPSLPNHRESARRSSCQCNLKQYGLALHNYNDLHGSLPSGYASLLFGGTDNRNWGSMPPMNRVGWQVRILPFMEQSTIYNQLNWSMSDASQRIYNLRLNDGLPARRHNFYAAKCPTDPFPSINPDPLNAAAFAFANLRNFATSSYEGSMGAQQLESQGGCKLGVMGRASASYEANSVNYNQFAQGGRSFPRVDITQSGVEFTNALNGVLPSTPPNTDPAAQPLIQQLSGAFSANGYGVRFNEVSDGLSNTIYVGEVLPECTGAFQAGWWPMAAHRPTNVAPSGTVRYAGGTPGASTVIPINTFVTCPGIQSQQKRTRPFGGAGSTCTNNIHGAAAFGFKSRHPGVCQFVFGDGSVRSLSETIDHGVYQLLGAKSDGVTIPAYE
jgi:prepilin-type processing-associated H-X9-DG protein